MIYSSTATLLQRRTITKTEYLKERVSTEACLYAYEKTELKARLSMLLTQCFFKLKAEPAFDQFTAFIIIFGVCQVFA